MSNASNLRYKGLTPAYFAPFFNFKGLMARKCREGSINSESDATKVMRSLEKSLLGNRTVMNLIKEGNKNPRIMQFLSSALVSITADELSDGRILYINPSVLGGEVMVCVKNNRIAVQNFYTNSPFGVSIGTQVLTYSNEKYSIGVMRRDLQCGFAIEVCRDDSGIKGRVMAKITYIEPELYIVDRLDKYIDVTELLKGITD